MHVISTVDKLSQQPAKNNSQKSKTTLNAQHSTLNAPTPKRKPATQTQTSKSKINTEFTCCCL